MMAKDEVKVTKEEFKLISQIRNLKEKGFTDEDILQLDRNKEINKENLQKMRLETIKQNNRQITHFGRTIKHKQEQLDGKTSVEKHEGFIGDIKPLFMLENEIEVLEDSIKQLEEVNKAAQEEYDKDTKKTKN